ncbi:hypothetical protein CTA1_6830 [Colletotrichum tanaceti]|uniref:Uncharacterized protein n=1 Tax=Colletotrichum tanaceti TaxID=1306861 RepID=A0A4U6X053_9PEZI|nr:hypothetical protein CTA1_6830 [Colletotrichum tanaceti]
MDCERGTTSMHYRCNTEADALRGIDARNKVVIASFLLTTTSIATRTGWKVRRTSCMQQAVGVHVQYGVYITNFQTARQGVGGGKNKSKLVLHYDNIRMAPKSNYREAQEAQEERKPGCLGPSGSIYPRRVLERKTSAEENQGGERGERRVASLTTIQ